MRKIITVLLFTIICLSSFGQIDLNNYNFNKSEYKSKCYGSGPTYYTTRKLNIYESMSTESAVSGEIPSGETVEVTNSFFGESGWWEVCYDGETGWVKKAYLTRKQPNQKAPTYRDDTDNSSISSTDQNTDVGFAPFLAKASSSANFRTAPSTSSSVIRQLPAGTQLYVFSKQDANGFYKVIDIKTGKIGWVSKSLVKWTGEADINYSGAFQSTGSTSNYNSDVIIRNKSSYKITLVVGGEAFYLSPNSMETKSISPGKMYYIATAPGVIPSSGYQTFGSYQGYEWGFWVETRRY
jgi:uncharacterized protein YgiM (DUF1202 family)